MSTSRVGSCASDVRGGGHARYLFFVAFLILCFAGGGGSREDISSLLYLRPASAICLVVILAIPGQVDFKLIRMPFWLLICLTVLIAIQLVPLPPSIWTALPNRAFFAEGANVLGMTQPWRPISLSPDLTVNSLASMIVPITALIGFASIAPERRSGLLPILIGSAVISALLAVAQITSGSGSAFYTYRITNEVAAVGLFANRNHQAVLLALALPMLGVWAAQAKGDPEAKAIKRWGALGAGAIFLLMLLVTGSRAGLVLGGIAAIWAGYHYLELRRASKNAAVGQGRSLMVAATATIALGAILTYVAYGRAVALQRLFGQDLAGERRLSALNQLLEMVVDFFPFGSGFGSFDPMFRVREPFEQLAPVYFNHAHNDLLELLITGGGAAGMLLAVFIVWWGWKGLAALRTRSTFGVLGFVLIFILLLASLVDYPLRTPIMAAILAIACGWLGESRSKEKT